MKPESFVQEKVKVVHATGLGTYLQLSNGTLLTPEGTTL